MRCHEEWLVGADSQCEDEDHTQRPDGEGLAMMTHREHVLIERSTDADVAFNGKHDDDPRRRKAKHVRQPTEHRANHCTHGRHSTDRPVLAEDDNSPAAAVMGDSLATIDMGRNWGGCCAPFRGGMAMGPHVTIVSWSLTSLFSTNMAISETMSPCNTMSPVPRPASVPSGILIDPTVWPHYTNVTDRQTNRRDNGPIT